MKKIVLALALFSFGMLAHAFPVSVTYEAIVGTVGGTTDFYGLETDDDLMGTFYFDTDDIGMVEFIRSTHVADTDGGNADAHGFFGPDSVEVDDVDFTLEIINVGGIIDEEEEFGLIQFEGFFVEFAIESDLELVTGFGPDSEPVWIDVAQGTGALFTLLFDEEGEANAFVEFEVTSLHIEATPVPEPATLLLLGLGLAGLGFARKRLH